MNVTLHKRFEKLPANVEQKMVERISLFTQNLLDTHLRVHALHTSYKGSYRIDVTDNYRALYELIDDEMALFTHIGTHSHLYQ